MVGSAAGPTGPDARDPDPVQQGGELRIVAGLAGGEDKAQRQPVAVDDQMQLGRQAAAGSSERLPGRYPGQILVIRTRPLCPGPGGGARGAVGAPGPRGEPPRPSQSTSPAASPAACIAVTSRAQVPSSV